MKKNDHKQNFDNKEIAEQTLLSWIQTGLTMIGFGFGLGSIISLMQAEHYEQSIVKAIRIIAALLVFVGILSIALALLQHRSKLKAIESKHLYHTPSYNLSLIIGIVVSFLGMAAFFVILLHLIL